MTTAVGQDVSQKITVAGFAQNLGGRLRCTLNVPTSLTRKAEAICTAFLERFGPIGAIVDDRELLWEYKGKRIDFSAPPNISSETVEQIAQFFLPYLDDAADKDVDYGSLIGGARMFVCGSRFVIP